MARRFSLAALGAWGALALVSRSAAAEEPAPAPGPQREVVTGEPRSDPTVAALSAEGVAPPPLNVPYLQYGVALTGEFVMSPGGICDTPPNVRECILGSGGGVAARVGYRTAGPWYFGPAYELSKQDPQN